MEDIILSISMILTKEQLEWSPEKAVKQALSQTKGGKRKLKKTRKQKRRR